MKKIQTFSVRDVSLFHACVPIFTVVPKKPRVSFTMKFENVGSEFDFAGLQSEQYFTIRICFQIRSLLSQISASLSLDIIRSALSLNHFSISSLAHFHFSLRQHCFHYAKSLCTTFLFVVSILCAELSRTRTKTFHRLFSFYKIERRYAKLSNESSTPCCCFRER